MQLTLDKFGRVVIPKAIRDDFHLRPGDVLEVEEEDQCIVLRPVEGESALKEVDGLLVFTGEPVGDTTNCVAESRQERLRKLGAWGGQ